MINKILKNVFYFLAIFSILLVATAKTHEPRIENSLMAIIELLFALYWQREE